MALRASLKFKDCSSSCAGICLYGKVMAKAKAASVNSAVRRGMRCGARLIINGADKHLRCDEWCFAPWSGSVASEKVHLRCD